MLVGGGGGWGGRDGGGNGEKEKSKPQKLSPMYKMVDNTPNVLFSLLK